MQSNVTQYAQSTTVAELARLVGCLAESDFATLAGVKETTLDSWRKRGGGPDYILLGRNYLYPLSAIQSHLNGLVRARTIIDPKTVLLN